MKVDSPCLALPVEYYFLLTCGTGVVTKAIRQGLEESNDVIFLVAA